MIGGGGLNEGGCISVNFGGDGILARVFSGFKSFGNGTDNVLGTILSFSEKVPDIGGGFTISGDVLGCNSWEADSFVGVSWGIMAGVVVLSSFVKGTGSSSLDKYSSCLLGEIDFCSLIGVGEVISGDEGKSSSSLS